MVSDMDIFRIAKDELGLSAEEIKSALLSSLEGRELKFATDREGDKAERDVCDNAETFNRLHRFEAEVVAAEAKSTKAEATDKHACDKVTRNGGEL